MWSCVRLLLSLFISLSLELSEQHMDSLRCPLFQSNSHFGYQVKSNKKWQQTMLFYSLALLSWILKTAKSQAKNEIWPAPCYQQGKQRSMYIKAKLTFTKTVLVVRDKRMHCKWNASEWKEFVQHWCVLAASFSVAHKHNVHLGSLLWLIIGNNCLDLKNFYLKCLEFLAHFQ